MPINFFIKDKHNYRRMMADYFTKTVNDALETMMDEEAIGIEIELNKEEQGEFKPKNVAGNLSTDYWTHKVSTVSGGGRWNTTFQCSFTNEQPDTLIGGHRFANLARVRLDRRNGSVYPVNAPMIIWYEHTLKRYIARLERENSAEGHENYGLMVDNLMEEFENNVIDKLRYYYDS